MVCPQCKNKNFRPTKDVSKPLRRFGGNEDFNTVRYRRYICLQCGYPFRTKETFDRSIQVRRNPQENLFGTSDAK